MKKTICILILVFCAYSLFAFNSLSMFSKEESCFFTYKEPKADNRFQGLTMQYTNSKGTPCPLSFFHGEEYILEFFGSETKNRMFEINLYGEKYAFFFNKGLNVFCCIYNGNFYHEPHAVAGLVSSLGVLLTTEVYMDYGTTSTDRRYAYEKLVNQLLQDPYNCLSKNDCRDLFRCECLVVEIV